MSRHDEAQRHSTVWIGLVSLLSLPGTLHLLLFYGANWLGLNAAGSTDTQALAWVAGAVSCVATPLAVAAGLMGIVWVRRLKFSTVILLLLALCVTG
jgi:hypothetical protein